MDFSRRRFLETSSALLLGSALPWQAQAELPSFGLAPDLLGIKNRDSGAFAILQGATDENSTLLIIQHDSAEKIELRVRAGSGLPAFVAQVNSRALREVNLSISQYLITGLSAGLDYELFVTSDRGRTDRRIFRSMQPRKAACRFAVVSCMNDNFAKDSEAIWQALNQQECDFIVFLGDTVYADMDNPNRDEAGYERRYSESRAKIPWFRLPRLVPCLATWDDHDFGLNNSDESFPLRHFTRDLFRAFWGSQANLAWRPAFGVGSCFAAYGQRFYLMDDRSFRGPANERGSQQWGAEQAEWLLADLASSNSPAWLLNGGQYYGAYLNKESFEGNYAEDFRSLQSELGKLAAPVVFVSGDVHFSEIMRIEREALGYSTYEFTSSSIHSFTFPFHNEVARNPRRLNTEWRHNFLLFDAQVNSESAMQVRTRCLRARSRVSFERTVTIDRNA